MKIADLDPKLGRFGLKITMCSRFMKFGAQCKSNMLIINMVLGTDDLDPKLQIPANFVPPLQFAPIFMKFCTHKKMEHVSYEYNTRLGLERSRDYWLKMIIGCNLDTRSEHD